MSAAADWHAATRIAPPRYDANVLATWFARVDPTPLIRRGLPMIPAPAWDRSALSALFGLDSANHCFHVEPHRWATFHEPQITRGLSYYLSAGDYRQRLARSMAFVKAAAVCAGKELTIAMPTTSVCLAEENRSDLLVELIVEGRRVGASVEAKFGHALTKGQLPKALNTIRERNDDGNDALSRYALIVVAPDDPSADKVLRKNPLWRGASWWSLLLQFEFQLDRLTERSHDDVDFRRFRRTIWHRAY